MTLWSLLKTPHWGSTGGLAHSYSQHYRPWALPGSAGTMVLLSEERHSTVRASTRATVLSCYPKTFRDYVGVDQDSWLGPGSRTGFTLPALTAVYTDGSYKQFGGVRDHICKTTTSVSCAAMVGTMDHTTFSGIHIDLTQSLPSAFFSELTAATYAFRKAAPHVLIRSDCKSGISTVLKAAGGKLPRSPQGALTKSIRKKLTPPQLTWIESHPEKRKRLGDFDDGDCGIYFAGEEYTAVEFEDRSLLNTRIIDGDHLLQDLFLANRFSICHLDSPTSTCLRRIEDVVQTARVNAYKRHRDVLRSFGRWYHTNGLHRCTILELAPPSCHELPVSVFSGTSICTAAT